jgi:two-component system chemotaxis sensor kinase CheA
MPLILDPGAIAARAHIGMALEEDVHEVIETEAHNGASEYLLMQSGQEHTAVPLDKVLRIERIPRARMEWLGGVPVLRFGGALLPVRDIGTEGEEMTVVVCRDGERHVGVAVSHVLDVADGKQLEEAGTHVAARNVTLLNEKVTSIVPLETIPELPVAGIETAVLEAMP